MSKESRYARQVIVSQIGEEGQKRLSESKVAVIGCGGLGSPVLTYLALAGVGTLRFIDCDTVSMTNLNRQFFYETSDVNQSKSEATFAFLKKRNPEIVLEPIFEKLTEEKAIQLLKDMDVVVDCVDSAAVRRVVGQACTKLGISYIEGGIQGFYGYVLPVMPGKTACLECIERIAAKEKTPIPAIGAVAGVIGSLQVTECLKILLNIGKVRYGVMQQYDGIYGEFEEIPVMVRQDCSCQTVVVNDENHMQ